jgi:mono/diheme cytochrome c family protein
MTTRFATCTAAALLVIVFATTAWSGRSHQERPPREDPNSGPYLYRTYCASCHGSEGRGDGPAAKTLRAAPPDLTTIAERRNGAYPSYDVAQIIDGRKPLPGHTRLDMPVWGAVLSVMERQNEPAVKARVNALVTHLESLQRNR